MSAQRRATRSRAGIGCLVFAALVVIGGISNAAGCGAKPTPTGQSSPATVAPLVGGLPTAVAARTTEPVPTFDPTTEPQPVAEDPVPVEQAPDPAPDAGPVDAPNNPPNPPGATAVCNDGSFWFGASRRGACSHHSGVATWL